MFSFYLSRKTIVNKQYAFGAKGNQLTATRMNEDSGNGSNKFDLKVGVVTNPLRSNSEYQAESEEVENSTFTMNQTVLQNISETIGEIQQITYDSNDHITQFHIQMPLSIRDVQGIHKINHNVFISQAALSEGMKGLPEESILLSENGQSVMMVSEGIVSQTEKNIVNSKDSKHEFFKAAQPVKDAETKLTESEVDDNEETIIIQESSKEYLPDSSFNADQHGNLFVKNENSTGNVIQSEEIVEGRVKCETEHQLLNLPLQQIMYVQVATSESSRDNVMYPVTVSDDISQTVLKASQSMDHESKRKCNGRIRNKKMSNIVDKSNLPTLAPRLLALPLYAGAQAAVGVGKSLLKPVNLGALQIVEGGQYFEVLGRCTQCFRFSRTTTYCRAEKSHRDPKSSVCLECEALGLSTVVCRRKLNHSAPNAQPLNIVINTALQNIDHVKQLCLKNNLPPCFCELHSIVVHHADITFVGQRKCNTKLNWKTEEKLNYQEYENDELRSEVGLKQNSIDSSILSTNIRQSGSSMLSDNGLSVNNLVTLCEDDNSLSKDKEDDSHKVVIGQLNDDLIPPQIASKPYLLKSALKFDCNELDYSGFVSLNKGTRKSTDYARGYLYPYSKEKWSQWLMKFCYQTCTNFRIRTGKRVNKKLDHGLANHNGRIVPYRTLETQLYNCALGGRPRKRKAKDGIKKRKERGSKLIGCPAVIHTRLLETEYDWCALEVTAPKILAHLPFHNPRGNNIEDFIDCDDILLHNDLPTKFQTDVVENNENKFDFVHEVPDETDNVDKKKFHNLDVKKSTKNLLLTCASLTEIIDNSSFLLSIQEQSRELLDKMHKEALNNNGKQLSPKTVKRKKFSCESEEVIGLQNIFCDKGQTESSSNSEQIEHIGMVNILD